MMTDSELDINNIDGISDHEKSFALCRWAGVYGSYDEVNNIYRQCNLYVAANIIKIAYDRKVIKEDLIRDYCFGVVTNGAGKYLDIVLAKLLAMGEIE